MAQVVLSTAASAVSSFGSAIASTAASSIANLAASTATSLIFGPNRRTREGPRLDSFTVQASTEGASILRVFGRARLSGQVIWAANFRETISEDVQSGKGARLGTQTTTTTFSYSISLAVGLCEGEISRIGRVWADGKPFDLSLVNSRVYQGSESQMPDGIIESVEGPGQAPAFRGLAYIVFEDLPLAEFGNRIPQFSFEIEKPLEGDNQQTLEKLASAINIIPSSGEFVYGTTPVTRTLGEGIHLSENVHHNNGGTDFSSSLDALESNLQNVRHTALVVAWFGTDLRLGECEFHPGVETDTKQNLPFEWSVSGQTRENAYLISELNGQSSYGGTPTDIGVMEAIADMAQRGLKIMFHPFILMDVAPGSNLPDPDQGIQSPYPWRGRIRAGNIDQSDQARLATKHFFGSAQVSDFSISENGVIFSGDETDNGFRRMILHYAHLCALANIQYSGAIEAFLLGSELRGVSRTRDENGNYVAVEEFIALARDVRAILGPDVAISYGADWSEYFGHQPGDGSNDRFFHLDPLWADDDIDFIGIDYYMPISDWRPGRAHLDAENSENGPYALSYLQNNIRAGEGYDWFYASDEDRIMQIRTPIEDGAHGEDWVFRYKDLWNWWANPHHDRPAGVRAAQSTAWVPQSKKIVFTEIGCPAICNGASQPNVFVDPKSVESAFPHFSDGSRDDLAQRRLLEAHALFWRDEENNPVSSVYGSQMVDPLRQYIYAWDARPFPEFPARNTIWGDTENWTLGHWLNGRVGRAPLDLLVNALAAEADFDQVDTSALEGVITGYIIDRPLSPRETIDPLADIFQFDIVESNGALRFQQRFGPANVSQTQILLTRDQLVAGEQNGSRSNSTDGDSPFVITTTQSQDLPSAFRLGFFDEGADLMPAVAQARDPGLRSVREALREIPAVMPIEEAEARARAILADAWVMRERIELSLPPSMVSIEPGDLITFVNGNLERQYRITQIQDGDARQVEAVCIAPSVYDAPPGSTNFGTPAPLPAPIGPLDWALLDLPYLGRDDVEGAPWFAAFSNPWPGGGALYRDIGDQNSQLSGVVGTPAIFGRVLNDLAPSPSGRWINRFIDIRTTSGVLTSRDPLEVLGGANAIALESENGFYEIVQFQNATLLEAGIWRLSTLLRGQLGTENEARLNVLANARVVLLTPTLRSGLSQIDLALDHLNSPIEWRAGPQRVLPSETIFTSRELTMRGRNLMPLAPVHIRIKELDEGQLISWIRRTRIGGDNWEVEEVPLGELTEEYKLIFRVNDEIVRTVNVTEAAFIYTNQMRDADLANASDGVNSLLTIEISQRSDRVGAGIVSAPVAL